MLPQGWQLHPNAPGYMWNPQTNAVLPVPVTPTPMYVPPPPQLAQQQPAQAGPGMAYLLPTEDMYAQEAERLKTPPWKRDSDDLPWLKWEALTKIGDVAKMRIRILPNAFDRKWWAESSQHRLTPEYAKLIDGQERRKVYFYACLRQNCPLCSAIEDLMKNDSAKAIVKQFRPRTTYIVAAIDLNDPSKHWQQIKDPSGNPVIGPDGQPQWKIVPAFFEMPSTLYETISMIAGKRAQGGDVTHPEVGRPFELTKTKTGPEDMNVEYNAIDESPSPIDPALMPILVNRQDPTQIRALPKLELLQEVAAILRSKFQTSSYGHAPPQYAPPQYVPPQPQYAPPPQYPPQFIPQGPPPAQFVTQQQPPVPQIQGPPAFQQAMPAALPMHMPPPMPPAMPPAMPPPGSPGMPPPPPGMPPGAANAMPPMPNLNAPQFEQQVLGLIPPPPKGDGGVPF